MKFIAALIFVLLSVLALTNANHWGCQMNSPCGAGRICHTLHNFCSCVEISSCMDVTLTSKVMSKWEVAGKSFTQYDVTIANNLMFDIQQIYIGTDASLTLRDYESIWNVNRLPNGELTLPSYQPSINKNSSYTFGFIITGDKPASMAIFAVTF